MSIAISIEHNQFLRQPYATANSVISGRHLRDIELYISRGLAPERPLREVADSPGQLWFMFFDGDSCLDWTDVLDRFTTYSSQIMVCVVNSDYSTTACLVNSHSICGIAGYAHPVHDNLERSCLNIPTYLNRHANSVDGFLTVHGSRQEARLPPSSICYIETVKRTYMYNIHCSDGEYVFHSGIKELSEKLGPPFR